MKDKALADNREIARHNEMKALVVLGKLNNEPLYVTRIIKEGSQNKGLQDWEMDKTTKPGLRSALTRLEEEEGILTSFMAESEIRHRDTLHYKIVPALDIFAKISETYGLSVVSFLRSSKFGQLVIVDNLRDYLKRKLEVDEGELAGCSELLRDITFLAQHSARALEVLLSTSLLFDRELPKAQPEKTKAIITYLRNVMNMAFAFDMAVSSRMKLKEEGITAKITLTTMATIENKEVKIVSNIRTDKATKRRS